MLIDEIRPLKGGLVGLYSDGEPVVTLDSELAAKKNIRAGQEYSVDRLRELLYESQLRRARAKALRLLNYRDYSRRDLAARLRREGEYGDNAIEAALNYLTEIGAIDDSRYAENMIAHLIGQKHYGRRRILTELAAKGIDHDQAEEALAGFDLDEPAAIRGLLEQKFSRDLADDRGVRRTVATLQRYGYATEDILRAIREFGDCAEEY